MDDFKYVTPLQPVSMRRQMEYWLSTVDGRNHLQLLQTELENAPKSLVILGQSDFWRTYQKYLFAAHARRKSVGELKILLQVADFECRMTNKGDWCGLRGKDDAYWAVASVESKSGIGTIQPPKNKQETNPWLHLGLEAGEASEVRAEIFRAFILEKYGSNGEDNVLACSAFKTETGMAFTDFFAGLSVKKIKLETWGEKHCIWVPYVDGGKEKVKVVPMRAHGGNEFKKLPKDGYSRLVELARTKVPEKIAFSAIAERYGISREAVLRLYCTALGDVLTKRWSRPRMLRDLVNGRHPTKDSVSRLGIMQGVRDYFIRLGRAAIGRGGPSRTRYLKKWVKLLQGNTEQDAKLELSDGRVVVGALLDASDDSFMVKIGAETDLIPVSEIIKIRGVDRRTVDKEDREKADKVPSAASGSESTGVISWWSEEKGFGFVKTQAETFYFDRSLISAREVVESLYGGYRHQTVAFTVESAAHGTLYARVKIGKLLQPGTKALQDRHQDGVSSDSNEAAPYLLTCAECDYVGYILQKTCDFHGLEKVGVHCYEDVLCDQEQERGQRFRYLLDEHRRALELLWGDRSVAERKRYIDQEYNHEMIRLQLTGCGLLLWSGDDTRSRTAWRLYLYRMLQEIVLSTVEYEKETVVACLVLMTRTLTRQDVYWHSVIPLLFVQIFRKESRERIQRLIEDDEYRNALASTTVLDSATDGSLIVLFRALRLGNVFSLVDEWLKGVVATGSVVYYDEFCSQSQARIADALSTLDKEQLVALKNYFAALKIPYVGSRDYREGLVKVLDAAIGYADADDYRDIVNAHDAVMGAVDAFEKDYVRGAVALPIVDVYYPCACEIKKRVDADFVGHSCQKVILSLKHAAAEKYYADDGEIELKLKLKSVNRDAHPIRDITIEIDGCVRPGYFPGPLNGGECHVFSLRMEIDDAEVKSGEGLLKVRVCYKYVEGEDSGASEDFELKYMVEEGVFESVPNPYLNFIKKPATGRMFVGREFLLDEIAEIFRSDSGGQGYVLYGQRRSGKTSVCRNVRERLGEEEFVYTMISAHALEEDLGMGGFSRALEDSIGNDLTDGALYVPDASVRQDDYLGRIRAISRAINNGRSHFGPRTWVVGFDEFTSLYDHYHEAHGDERLQRKEKVRTFLRELKALLEERVFNMLVIGQESVVQFQKDFPNEFAVLHLHRLTYLKEEDVKLLADNPIMKLRDNGERVSRYKGTSLHRLFYLTAGQPFFTQMFCKALVDYLNGNELHDVTPETIDAVELLLCEGDSKIRDAEFEPFVNLMTDVDEDEVVRLYYKIAEATEEESDWVPLSDFTDEQLSIVHLLDARGIVRVHQDEVQLRMGLFTGWLRRNLGRTRVSFGGKESANEY